MVCPAEMCHTLLDVQGMGEPLNNYKAVRAAITSIVDPRLWGLARSRVTVSTVGVVNQVKQLGLDLPVSVCVCVCV
jgi:23S rRNA (adenine2503-C2)-methyltransferase